MIIYKSFYNIDIRNSSIKEIAVPEDFVFLMNILILPFKMKI